MRPPRRTSGPTGSRWRLGCRRGAWCVRRSLLLVVTGSSRRRSCRTRSTFGVRPGRRRLLGPRGWWVRSVGATGVPRAGAAVLRHRHEWSRRWRRSWHRRSRRWSTHCVRALVRARVMAALGCVCRAVHIVRHVLIVREANVRVLAVARWRPWRLSPTLCLRWWCRVRAGYGTTARGSSPTRFRASGSIRAFAPLRRTSFHRTWPWRASRNSIPTCFRA